MDTTDIIGALSALAQPTRLRTFRLLVACEPGGIAAGEIARLAGVPQNTMSTHLAILARARLVTRLRQSRSVVYRANLDRLHDLTTCLIRGCCDGRADLCEPLLRGVSPYHGTSMATANG